MEVKKVLFIEPFYGGSHKQLLDAICKGLPKDTYDLVTLPDKKWHWKARCSALIIRKLLPEITSHKVLFCSSVLNLTELCGFIPKLSVLKKIIYFHENQLVYPVQTIKQRDIQYAYNQIISCLSADLVLFNSHFNQDSFLNGIKSILKIIPEPQLKPYDDVINEVRLKSEVLYFPVSFPKNVQENRNNGIHIVWPHRWEFDKGPEDLFQVLFKLKDNNVPFQISILGESFTDNPEIFERAKSLLEKEIVHFGFIADRNDYFEILSKSHVVVSTAKHEFFGVSMLEAAFCGAFPLVPNNLVYPEIYPKQCLFENLDDLYNKLEKLCLCPEKVSELRETCKIDFNKFDENNLLPKYLDIINN